MPAPKKKPAGRTVKATLPSQVAGYRFTPEALDSIAEQLPDTSVLLGFDPAHRVGTVKDAKVTKDGVAISVTITQPEDGAPEWHERAWELLTAPGGDPALVFRPGVQVAQGHVTDDDPPARVIEDARVCDVGAVTPESEFREYV